MTVKQLIAKLEGLKQDAEVVVSIRVFTQAHSVAECGVYSVDALYTGAALHVSLPENMHVVTRKKR